MTCLEVQAVGREDLAFPEPDHGGRAGRMETSAEDPHPAGLGLLDQGVNILHHPLQRHRRRRRPIRLVDGEQVLLHLVSLLHVTAGTQPDQAGR
jgi:hypothetical protein